MDRIFAAACWILLPSISLDRSIVFFNDLLVTIIKVKVKSLGSSLIINAFEGIKNRIVAEFNPIESVAFASDQPFLCGLIE